MAGRVDDIQLIRVAIVGSVIDPHGVRLDGDSPLALEIHLIEELSPHVAFGDRPGPLEKSIGQRRLPVIDVGDDAEIADARLIHCISVRGSPLLRHNSVYRCGCSVLSCQRSHPPREVCIRYGQHQVTREAQQAEPSCV